MIRKKNFVLICSDSKREKWSQENALFRKKANRFSFYLSPVCISVGLAGTFVVCLKVESNSTSMCTGVTAQNVKQTNEQKIASSKYYLITQNNA